MGWRMGSGKAPGKMEGNRDVEFGLGRRVRKYDESSLSLN
jgi:hypothetical protein